jgi:hypothetical protein
MSQLYGTQDDPSSGILNVLTGGLATDAVNYSQCEQQVYNMFNQFESALATPSTQSAGDTQSPAQQDVIDAPYPTTPTPYYHTTSVNETF